VCDEVVAESLVMCGLRYARRYEIRDLSNRERFKCSAAAERPLPCATADDGAGLAGGTSFSDGRSMEAEVRAILMDAVTFDDDERPNLAQVIRERFGSIGGAELDIPPRQDMPRAAELPTST
jgi:plasmid stability protein